MRTLRKDERQDIRTLHYGRGVAALLVCLFHSYGLIEKYAGGIPEVGNIFQAGHSGVEFFFILSGFIIMFAHRRDVGHPEKVTPFLLKRAIRVLPLFWLVTLPFGAVFLLAPVFGSDRALTGAKLLTDLLLIPREGTLTLPPAWTLQHEAVFYLIFTLALVHRTAGIIAISLWQAVCILTLVFALYDPNYLLPLNTLIGFHNLGFGVGVVIALLFTSRHFASLKPLALTGGAGAGVALLGMFAGEWIIGPKLFGGETALALSYFAIYAAIILALLSIREQPRPSLDTTLGVLGSASYALYLTHEPVGSTVNKLLILPALQPAIGPVTAYIAIALTCIAAALAIHFAVERPAIAWLKRNILAGRQPRPALGPWALTHSPRSSTFGQAERT